MAAAALWVACGVQAQVQVPMDPALERQVEEAYRQVLERPDDLARWSRYAQVQVQGGNYEGGIGALERLMLQPNYPPEIPLEIATLYFRLGSYAQSQAMAEQALADQRLAGERREFAQRLVRESQKRLQRSQLTGFASFGLRSQSNPAYRTSESEVLSGGTSVPVAANQRPASDWDANLNLRLQHRYDLELQNSGSIVTNFGASVVDYNDSSGSVRPVATGALDLRILDLNTGFEFRPSPAGVPGLSLRPHVSLAHVVAQRRTFVRSEGVGLDMTYRPHEQLLVDVTLDVQRRSFEERVDFLNAADHDGRLTSLRARVTRELAPGRVITGELTLRRNNAERDFHDFDQQEARVIYGFSYAAPGGLTARQWTTSMWVGAVHRSYDAPDPTYSPTTARKDDEWRVGLSQTIPIADQWFAQFSLEHSRNRSSLPNFRNRNTSASASVLRSF